MSEAIDPVVVAVDAAIKAAHAATGRRSIITLVALAHAFSAWRESCLRDARTSELDPRMAPLVAQVDALMANLREGYTDAAEAERVDGAIARELDVTVVTRVFTPRGEKGAA